MTSSNLRLSSSAVNVTLLVHRCLRPQPPMAVAWRWLAARWARQRRERAAAHELRSMGERDLQDLGIGRSQVRHLLDRA
jgi:uncharacterized protein YjiS (DUF1127 family)